MDVRGWFRPRRHSSEPTDAPADRCELCGVSVAEERVCGLVADAAVVRPNEPALDGWRLLTACSREHLLELTTRCQQTEYQQTGYQQNDPDPIAAGSRRA
ncbi:hypothetical protein [Rugosimonospora africana]|uniref:Uncharacterized protein n=1 Tax=Rugosimonospora africana TaxID=556532 RepID=A0A8J3QWJ9_9ACTN|nr:hypothetical protein [Rugosimonospora africana]GIH17866.1 hypothetical protein Raf01_60380 [Rugosimonospora africana]